MGEYRLSIYFKWQFGFSIGYDYQLFLTIPFFTFRISTRSYAKGFGMFFKR